MSFKKLDFNRKASKEVNSLAINPMPVHTSGCSLSKRIADASTQAASLQSYSQKFVALSRIKPLKINEVGRLPIDDELFEVNSKTSLFDSPDGKVGQLPPSLQHSTLRNTENQNPEEAAQKDRISSQATE